MITFLNPVPWAILLLAVILLSGFIFFSYYQFSILTRRRVRLILGILRILLLFLMVFMILDPYRNRVGDADWIGVLVDTSQSMNVSEMGLTTRVEKLKTYFEEDGSWAALQKTRIKKRFTFDTQLKEHVFFPDLKAKGKASRLVSAMEEIESRYREDANLLGWILFSDGAATDVPQDQKVLLPEATIPYVTVGMGWEEEVPNVEIQYPTLPQPVFVGDVLSFVVKWKSTMPAQVATLLSVKLDNKPLIEKNINLKGQSFSLDVIIQEPGNHFLDIALAPLAEEGSDADNVVRVGLRAYPRETRVFYAESFYKEKNFFKEALEEDPSFKVSFASSLVGFARKFKVPFIKDPIYGFPGSRSELFQYDAVVLSDVKRDMLSADQMQWIYDLVNEEGGALVMVGGVDSFGDGGYVGTPIEGLLPIEMSEDYKQTNFLKARGVNENPFRPVISSGAENHPMLQLAENPATNRALWEAMPLLGGFNYVGRVKPAATLLLEHPSEKSTFGPRPILAVQPFGKGKVLAFTSDVTPNWGEWFQEWKDEKQGWLYAQFWRGMLKSLTENRIRSRVSLVSISREPMLVESMKPVAFQITLPKREQAQTAELKLEILKGKDLVMSEIFKDPEGTQIPLKIPHLEPGDYSLKAFYGVRGEIPILAEMPFAVHPSRIEAQHLKVNHDLLKQLARETHGVFLPFSKIGELEKALKELGKTHLRQHSAPFWNQPLFYGLFLVILFLDWGIRKKLGLE